MRTRFLIIGATIALVVATVAVVKVQSHKVLCRKVTHIIKTYADSPARMRPERITPQMLRVAASLRNLNIDEKELGGRTRLHIAAALGDKDIARLLLAAGASTRARDDDLETPLHTAVQFGSTTIAEMLIAKGSDVDSVDAHGMTPVYMAASRGNKRLVALLCEQGASPYQAQQGKVDGCMANLMQIEAAKEQWAMDHDASLSSTPTRRVLKEYMRPLPTCPDGGTYETGDLMTPPSCSVHGACSDYGGYR